MSFVVESFSANYTLTTMPIRKGWDKDGVKLEHFLNIFRSARGMEDVKFVDPGLGWDSNQYDGKVCVGIFEIFTLVGQVPEISRFGMVASNTHWIEHRAVEFMLKHRQTNPDGSGIRPTVAAAPHWLVYPVELPKDGML